MDVFARSFHAGDVPVSNTSCCHAEVQTDVAEQDEEVEVEEEEEVGRLHVEEDRAGL